MSINVNADEHSVTATVTQLLTRLGYDERRSEPELAIDRFDQWTNPRGAVLVPSTDCLVGMTALEQAA
jgi:hypothetical protein